MKDKKRLKEDFRRRIYGYMLRLIKFLSKAPNGDIEREIKKQLIRSGTSVGANYFEAEAASSKKDYQNFFSIALKSANESKMWLALLRDSGCLPDSLIEEGNYLLEETKEISNILASSILTMKGRK